MIDIHTIYESMLSEQQTVDGMIDVIFQKYEKYRRRRGDKYNNDEEGLPVKQIGIRDNYFRMFCAEHRKLVGVSNIICEFADAKLHGKTKRRWNRINARQYQTMLNRFMSGKRISLRAVTDQLDKLCECALDLIALETIAVELTDSVEEELYIGTAIQYDFSLEELIEEFRLAFDDYAIDLDKAGELADELLEWAAFSNHKSTSDFGPLYLISVLGNTNSAPSLNEAVIALNKGVDVIHASNDLAAAFITGGCNSLDTIRYGNGVRKTTRSWLTGGEIPNADLQEILEQYSSYIADLMQTVDFEKPENKKKMLRAVLSFLKQWDNDIVNKANAMPKLKHEILRISKETLANLDDIYESDIEYSSIDVKDIIVQLYWIKSGGFMKPAECKNSAS